MEAYCRGSWWDAKVLGRDGDNYHIHYETFSPDDDEWVPIGHLRLRSRLTKVEDCQNVLEPGIDVCVMANHPQANSLPVSLPISFSLFSCLEPFMSLWLEVSLMPESSSGIW